MTRPGGHTHHTALTYCSGALLRPRRTQRAGRNGEKSAGAGTKGALVSDLATQQMRCMRPGRQPAPVGPPQRRLGGVVTVWGRRRGRALYRRARTLAAAVPPCRYGKRRSPSPLYVLNEPTAGCAAAPAVCGWEPLPEPSSLLFSHCSFQVNRHLGTQNLSAHWATSWASR